MAKLKRIGILTAGGDSPGLNAAIRGVGKAALDRGIRVTGFKEGFRGLVENRCHPLDRSALSGILTHGGTILGTGRDKPHRMLVDGEIRDMTATIAANYLHHRLDALVCIGGGGTQKNALRLAEAGLNIITLPKTIDNDIALTDTSIGFDTATSIATETIDRLHSTAHSHHRIIVLEVMGHRAGWLALAAGIAGGADVILIPEMPYSEEAVAAAIRQRSGFGLPFSIVAVAEGSVSARESKVLAAAVARKRRAMDESARERASLALAKLNARHVGHTWQLSRKLEALTGLEARITILGYVQRGGSPNAADRLLATQLGTRCIEALEEGHSGVMVAVRGGSMVPVPLRDVAGTVKLVPPDHPWLASARRVGTCLGA